MNQIALPPPTGFNNGAAPAYYYSQQEGSPYRDAQGSDQAFAYLGQQPRLYQDGGQGMGPPSSTPATGGSLMMQPGTRPYSQPGIYAQAPVNNHARQSASPQKRFPAATAAAASHLTSPTNHAMAAPPLPQTPSNHNHQSTIPAATNNASAASPTTPTSPHSSSSTPQPTTRDQKRIALLLSINTDLLTEVQRLQAQGQGGAMNPQQANALRKDNQPVKMASDDYIQCLRRVQANLAYLMPKAQPAEGKAPPPGPAHMTPPPHMPVLAAKYAELGELFPGWQGLDHRLSGSTGGGATGSPRVVQQGASQQNSGAAMA